MHTFSFPLSASALEDILDTEFEEEKDGNEDSQDEETEEDTSALKQEIEQLKQDLSTKIKLEQDVKVENGQ